MTPSQLLARIEALGSIDAKYIDGIRKQVQDPTKVVKSKAIIKFLLSKHLITKADAQKLLAPPTEEKIEVVKPSPGFDSSTFNDDPDYVPVKRFNPLLILAFLNFHRRFILGALLLVGVAYFLMRADSSSPADEGSDSVARVGDSVARSDGIEATTSYPTEPADQGSSEPVLLTADQQINRLLASANDWRGKSVTGTVTFFQTRCESVEKLMTDHDLKPRQHAYCVQEYIKSLGSLSEQSQKLDAGVEGIDEKIAEVVKTYGESENGDIAALANAALVGHLARQFIEASSSENLEALKVAFLERQDVIAKSELAQRHITRAIRDATAKAGDSPKLREIAAGHLSNVLFLNDVAVVDLAKNLYFPEVDWLSLKSRLQTRSPGADSDVELLLASAKEHPDMPLMIYSNIGSAIKWYQVIDENEKAQQFLSQLEEIGETITSKRIHDEVQKGIQILKDSPDE